jgi:hypothetical protein
MTRRPVNVVHVESGFIIVPEPVAITIDEDGTGTVGPIPHTDNDTLAYWDGTDWRTGFAYRVEWNIPSNEPSPQNRTIALPAALGATADYDAVDTADVLPGVVVPYRGVPVGGTTGQVLAKNSNTDFDTEWVAQSGGGGGGAVDSVNGQTGVVVVDADDIADAGTKVIMTTTERTKLSGVATGATANATDAQLRDRSTHTGTQSADTLTDGATNHVFTAADNTKLAGIATGASANSSDATLLARANHTGTQSADTLTDGTTNKAFLATERTKLTGVATGATANDTDANLKARANHTGTQSADTLTDGTTNKAFLATERTAIGTNTTGIAAINTELGVDPSGPFATVAARLQAFRDGKHANAPFVAQSGRYYWGGLLPPSGSTASVTSQTTAANRMYVTPIMFRTAKTIDRIGCNIGTGAAGNARLGIYPHDPATGLPANGAPLLDAGTVDVSTTGGKEITISQALDASTIYWLVYLSDTNASVRATNAPDFDGGMAAVGDTNHAHGGHFGVTYGALPSSLPAITYETKPTNFVFVRIT